MIDKPLAYRMRPKTLNEVIGQDKIKSFLGKLIENDSLLSMIFYGAPGTGKTTLAKAFCNTCNCYSLSLNAVIDNKARMEAAFEEAICFQPSVVIIDEIHRMDKGKQDILLPHLENGDFYLIGCTTANPLISLNPAIRSRTRLLETQRLTPEEIYTGLSRAIHSENGLDNKRDFEKEGLIYLSKISGGDLRFAYNQLEAIAMSFSASHTISLADVQEISNAPNYLADKDEDEHYNTLSAFQKSIRGSDIDASLYYLAKLIKSQDLEGIARRLKIIAYEDVGFGNPQAVDRVFNAIETAREVGFPEAMIPLGFAVIDLASSPKSRSAADAIEAACATVDESPTQVRDYLKFKRVTKDTIYNYPYDDPNVWPLLKYMPEGLEDITFFHPNLNTKYEKAMAEYRKLHEKERTSDMKEAKRRAHLI